MRVFFIFLLCLPILSCNGRNKSATNNSAIPNYQLDTAWSQVSNKYVISQPTGIGVDKYDHIFVFQRTGRKWTEPFPDSLISQNTVLEFDNETGEPINSWGANYFIMPHGFMD